MRAMTAIVIGGGVTGLSAAYHLARKECGRVILFEKDNVGDGSSSRAAGIITGLLWTEAGVLARKKALALFREFSGEFEGYHFHDVGCLNLWEPEEWQTAQQLLPLYRRLGAPFEVLEAAEIRRRWPSLTPDDNLIGLFDPMGGYSEPCEYIPALARRCRDLGVEIRERQQVTGFLLNQGRVCGVTVDAGNVEGDAVICTVLAWTSKVLEPLGIKLPVKAFVHQRYLTEPFEAPVRIPAVNANFLGGYIRPALGNRILAGIETSEREEFRVPSMDFRLSSLSARPELQSQISEKYAALLPILKDVNWESKRIGLITFSMDGEPILGPVERLSGFYVGTAFHSGGFAYNPVSGLLLSECVMGLQTSIDISSFSPDRFDANATEKHLARTLRQRDASPRRH